MPVGQRSRSESMVSAQSPARSLGVEYYDTPDALFADRSYRSYVMIEMTEEVFAARSVA